MRKVVTLVLIALGALLALVIVVLIPFLVLTPRPPKAPSDLSSIDRLEAYLSALTRNETPPAISVTVARDGRIIWSKAFGIADAPAGRSATPESVYHFWSVTKLFTATAIMQLVEAGIVGLDDPVSKYLPQFRTRLDSGRPVQVTIRQLLSHTSGMSNLALQDLVGWIHHLDDAPVDQTVIANTRLERYLKLKEAPGRVGAYSNAGYIVLGAVVETASGESYEDYIRDRILRPLGMTMTDFIYRQDMTDQVVSGSHPIFHLFTPILLLVHNDWFANYVSKTIKHRMWLRPLYTDYTGPTGLVGTSEDLARFGEAFLSGGNLGGRRILKDETVNMMLNEGFGANTGPDGDRMGLGWHWWNHLAVPFKGHGGDGPGFSAQLAVLPEKKMTIAVLANDTLTDRVAITQAVAMAFK